MKIIKRILMAVLSILCVCVILFCISSLMLSDKNINGFVGTTGIIREKLTGDLYTELDNNPIKMLIKQDNYEIFLQTYFDKVDMLYFSGHGEKNNISYKFSMSAFTRNYFVVTIVIE